MWLFRRSKKIHLSEPHIEVHCTLCNPCQAVFEMRAFLFDRSALMKLWETNSYCVFYLCTLKTMLLHRATVKFWGHSFLFLALSSTEVLVRGLHSYVLLVCENMVDLKKDLTKSCFGWSLILICCLVQYAALKWVWNFYLLDRKNSSLPFGMCKFSLPNSLACMIYVDFDEVFFENISILASSSLCLTTGHCLWGAFMHIELLALFCFVFY